MLKLKRRHKFGISFMCIATALLFMLSITTPVATTQVSAARSTTNYTYHEIKAVILADNDNNTGEYWSVSYNNWNQIFYVKKGTPISSIHITVSVVGSGTYCKVLDWRNDTRVFIRITAPNSATWSVGWSGGSFTDTWDEITYDMNVYGTNIHAVYYNYYGNQPGNDYYFNQEGTYTVYVEYQIYTPY